jgi:hypothetical protein
VLDEDGEAQEDDGSDDEPELLLQRMLFVLVMMLVRATLAMFMMMRMCHIFALFLISRRKGTALSLQLGCKHLNPYLIKY